MLGRSSGKRHAYERLERFERDDVIDKENNRWKLWESGCLTFGSFFATLVLALLLMIPALECLLVYSISAHECNYRVSATVVDRRSTRSNFQRCSFRIVYACPESDGRAWYDHDAQQETPVRRELCDAWTDETDCLAPYPDRPDRSDSSDQSLLLLDVCYSLANEFCYSTFFLFSI